MKSLKELKRQWDQILNESGFEDIEDSKGNLKSKDRRTISFDSRNIILEFHLSLSEFLETTDKLPPLHRKILELYSCGIYIKVIAQKVECSDRWVRKIIKDYQLIILRK